MSATRQEGAHKTVYLDDSVIDRIILKTAARAEKEPNRARKTFLRKGQLNRNTRFGSQYLPFCSSHMALGAESGQRSSWSPVG